MHVGQDVAPFSLCNLSNQCDQMFSHRVVYANKPTFKVNPFCMETAQVSATVADYSYLIFQGEN
ncbi:hypothetical protein IscW_ISCW001935 [Ixodes scapularis]|uniref:Uncharacterized protein n=1 Tax=Ixodes scapularis TaxID=6945 RepID=B7P7K1_IXOSC|nr:hypothetical protein IscW_ISCW001935 [Ixodes scapularis]|eukprot:XP_002399266.1 hypothetical protein IscW_ISCW001935 [Ixodes scapularis]